MFTLMDLNLGVSHSGAPNGSFDGISVAKAIGLNPLTPNNDQNEISLSVITIFSNIQEMRIKKVSPRIRCLDI